MGTAVRSDGNINRALKSIAARLNNYNKDEIDRYLTDDNILRQCKHETLCLLFAAYYAAYKDKNWHIQRHIAIKAWQSADYRAFCKGVEPGAPATASPTIPTPDDPINILRQYKPTPGPSIIAEGDGEDPINILKHHSSPDTGDE